MTHLHSSIPYIVMGFSSMLLQITVLRLLLATFSGNELDIGITLSFWLIYVGLGSYIGQNIRLRNAFVVSFLVIAMLAQPTVVGIKAIRIILSLEPGEVVSLWATVLSTAVMLLPLCFVIGLQFPLAVSHSGTVNAAGKVYGLEALGAFLGGILFTFVLSSRIPAFELCSVISAVNILMAIWLSGKRKIVILFTIPLIFYLSLHKITVTLPWHGLEVSHTAESRYGEIAVINIGNQSSVYANGHLLFTYPDSPAEEMNVHLAMALHPSPSNVLIIGGSPGIIKDYLKYNVHHIDLIELDSKIAEVAMKVLSQQEDLNAIKNNKVSIRIQDGRRYIKGLRQPRYDFIVLHLPQPSTASINRFYTRDFFREAKGVLRKDGIIALSLPYSTGYIGKRMQTASGSIYNSLASVFRHVEVTSQEYGRLFASDAAFSVAPEILEHRFMQRELSTRYFNRYIFRDAFSPYNTEYVRQRLEEVSLENTDLRPSAYLYTVMLWEEKHGGRFLTFLLTVRQVHVVLFSSIIFACILLAAFGKKRRTLFFSVFATGFSGMSFMLAVILAYESIHGFVYEMIGLLSALFMAGLWTGTVITRKMRYALRGLCALELATILTASVSSLFFNEELFFYVLVCLFGMITGGQFSTANLSLADKEAGGKLYAFDLAGSFLGALLSSLIIIPLFGVSNALLLIAMIKMFSAVLVLRIAAGSLQT
ncbi:MAG: hypothetical protein AB1552_08305 [Nitrospirota bacterium]